MNQWLMEQNKKNYLYGPVPSRRLGFSLGIDIIPFKTCTFDCIYCQLGKTTNKTLRRKEYIPVALIISQLEKILKEEHNINYLTFSGSGEPTLNSQIGKIIKLIKKISKIPVAVLTNGSLLYRKEVQEGLLSADLVVPSLDAATPQTFKNINRPHHTLAIEKIIEGLKTFRQNFSGKFWLEIMLVKNINDTEEEIVRLKEAIAYIKPDKVQLNTVIRPPTCPWASPLSPKELKAIKRLFGENCEIVSEFKREKRKGKKKKMEDKILSLIKRRPVTLSDLSFALGFNQNELIKYLQSLQEAGRIKLVIHHRRRYYEPA